MLSAFLLEVILEIYLSSFDNMRKTSKFAALFYFKIAVLALLMADEVLQGCNVNLRGRPVRPFKVFRASKHKYYYSVADTLRFIDKTIIPVTAISL